MLFSLFWGVILWIRSWKPFWDSKRPLGDLWEVLLEAFGGRFGDSWELLGPSWGHLGRLDAQDAPKNSRRRPQELPKTAPRGPRRPPKGFQEAPKKAQEATQRGRKSHPIKNEKS